MLNIALAHSEGGIDIGQHSMMSWGWFGFGWVFMILFWLLIILAIIALAKWIGQK